MGLNDANAAKECLKAIECCIARDGQCEYCPYRCLEYRNCVKELQAEATRLIKIHIPMKVKVENWSPNICPNCGKEIDEHIDDGYYLHPEYDHCPYCLQKLCY